MDRETPSLSDDVKLRQRLRTETLEGIDFNSHDSGDYHAAVRTIHGITNIPIILTPDARSVVDSEGLSCNFTLVGPTSIENLLNGITYQKSENLSWRINCGAVQISS